LIARGFSAGLKLFRFRHHSPDAVAGSRFKSGQKLRFASRKGQEAIDSDAWSVYVNGVKP
jgi:hypothetical protein